MFTDERRHELTVYYDDFKQRIYDAGYEPFHIPTMDGGDIDRLPLFAFELLEVCEEKFGWEELLRNLKKYRWNFEIGTCMYAEVYSAEFRERLLPLIQASNGYDDMRKRAGDLLHQVAKEKKHHFRWY